MDPAQKPRPLGRPRKPDKLLPISSRVEPEVRNLLEALAKQKDRSLSEETGDLLKRAVYGGVGAQSRDVDQSSLRSLLARLESDFGRQIAGVLAVLGYAMLYAELDSIAWSHDAAERTRQLPVLRVRTGLPMRRMTELWDLLHQSSPAHKTEQPWLSDDPFVFGQMAAAARSVLEMLAPEGDPSPPRPPRGISPTEAADVMTNLGENAALWAIGNLTEDTPPALRRSEPQQLRALNDVSKADLACLRTCLGEPAFARLKQWLAGEEWEWRDPAEGQSQDG